MSDIFTLSEKLTEEFKTESTALAAHPDPDKVEAMRVSWLGRKGKVTKLMEEMRNVAKEDRPKAGKTMNQLRGFVDSSIKELQAAAQEFAITQILDEKPIDITLPVSNSNVGYSLHPVTLMREKLLSVFKHLGFTIYDGPELDYDFYNFSALNIPDNHPARDMQDTFHLKHDNMVLRTQTSNIQIHAMLNEKPPLRLVAPGRVYRVDSDPTHTPMFHQMEALVVDKHISLADLKGLIQTFVHEVYGSDLKTRLRPSFFPFVEPGVEVDLQCTICRGKGCRVCSHTGWLEIGGAGMVHPNVFEAVNLDSEEYTGFAFGFGIDRMAMLGFGIPDLRQIFEGDAGFQSQFPIHATKIQGGN